MRSRGLNSNDYFGNKDKTIEYIPDEGSEFEVTDRGIQYRKIEVQGKPVGYEFLIPFENRYEITAARVGAEYLSEVLRTMAVETRDILGDLI